MDAAPPATVASKVAKHVRNEERTTSRKMRNFLLDAAEAWGTMCEYPAVNSDARGRGSGVRVARDL